MSPSALTIVHLITGLGTGGAEAMLFKVLSGMDRQKFRMQVISLGGRGQLAEQIEMLGIPVHALEMNPGRPGFNALMSLRAIIRPLGDCVAQGWMYHGNLAASLVSFLSSSRVPVIWNIRQSLDDRNQLKSTTQLVIRLGSWFSGNPHRIIYNSKRGAEQHEQFGYSSIARQIIPNGFDCEMFQPSVTARLDVRRELGAPADQVLLGIVGRFHPSKDHPTFLRAAALLGVTHPDVKFLMVGSGVDSRNLEIVELIEDLRLENRVYLLGERRDIPRLTAAMDIASISSLSEGFPNVVGEAMGCGVPCVVTDVGDAAVIVGDGALVAPSRDPAALAAIWGRLVEAGHVSRRRLGQLARARVLSNYSISSIAADYETLYRDVAEQGGIQRS